MSPLLVDRLRGYAERDPQRVAIHARDPLRRADWDRRARAVAAHLRPGTRVLILLPSGVDFFCAFAGALYAGACAVPALPPSAGRDPFVDVATDADVDAVVTTTAIAAAARKVWADRGASTVRWLELDLIEPDAADTWTAPRIGAEDLALLQYTSGSTGAPKGVAVNHRVLAAWLDVLGARVDLPAGSAVVTWAPAHHVLGLTFVLMAPHLDGEATLLAAEDVLADPIRWLRAISGAGRPVLSVAPPFGYQQCVDGIAPEERAGLDLSTWEVAAIGSERIRPRVLDRFAEAFGPHGFRRSAFFPAYGTTEIMMGSGHRGPAEPVLLTVSAAELERRRVRPAGGDSRSVELVACGRPGDGLEMIIVDPESRTRCGDGEVGELWVRGPAVAQGYWRRPEQTEEVFRARLADGTGPYQRTGDLAFFHEGELVVCGRLTELIIIRGRNLLPQDIESTVRAADPALSSAAVAAFSVDDEEGAGEHMIVVAGVDPEATGDPAGLAESVRRAVIAEHEVEPEAVHLVTPDQIPRTNTGKVRHGACRTALLEHRLRPLATAATRAPGDLPAGARDAVAGMTAALLGVPVPEIPTDIPLVQLGLDSMRMIKLRAQLAELGAAVPMDQLAGHTVASLAGLVGGEPDVADRTTIDPDPEHRFDPFALTELQHAYLVGRAGGYTLGGVGTHFYAEFDTADLDPGRLHEAWCRLVERHDMLRAVISAEGEQRVQPSVDPPELSTVDLSSAGPEEAARRLDDIRDEMSHQVFEPDTWPLFDIRYTRLPGGTVRVHVSLDLLVLDVWSLHILSREWRQLYESPDAELAPLGVSFRDYVLATQALDDSEEARSYWLDRLDSLPPGPELPLRRSPASLTEPPRFVRRRARLEPAHWAKLSTMATAAGLTPTSVLLAAYATVLGAWGRRSRFTLNLPTFNRTAVHPDIDAVIGDFTSVTLLEVDLAAAATFTDLARTLQHQLLRDLEHGAFNGVRVLRELARRRGADADVFAPVVFSSASGQTSDGVQEEPLAWLGEPAFGVSQTPQVLIDHQLIEDSGGLTFNWDTVDELFAGGVVDDMFAAYRDLLRQLASGDWNTEPPAPHLELVARVNDTAGELPDGTLVDDLVRQARRAPDRPAVIAADRTLTFGALYDHARRIADDLRGAGVRRGEPVAVAIPKSSAQVAAVVGVLLAGCAYVPVDPDLPKTRQARLLELGGCRFVLNDDATVSTRDTEITELAEGHEDLAYVIFTSGSTGEPKGVAVSHRAALNTCRDICERFGVGSRDRVLGLSSLSFDLSVWDIFGVLGAGGALVLPEPQAHRDPARWLELVREHGVTVWNSVPALGRMFVEFVLGQGDARPVPLRLAMLSGDWIPLDLPEQLWKVAPGCRVMSLGGATEAAIWSIYHEVCSVDPAWESIPYGRPLRNQRFHVLDDRWRECPVHVPGELYIAGAGLADGYYGDAERTAASFVTHPRTGERLYRTGDLGRRCPDGTIEFLGREDFQVKIGGFRIELGEIEDALLSHPRVRCAVVTALGDRHHRRLAACVVPNEDGPRGGAALTPEHVDPGHRDGMIFDEIERLEFKLARHGVRTDLTGPAVPLEPAGAERPTRASHRRFADRPVPVEDLARLLESLRGHDGDAMPKYAYASAGNAYAVQTYLYVADGAVAGLDGGTYYHDPARHQLVPVRPGARLDGAVRFGVDQHALDTAAFVVFFVAAMDAVRPLYGPAARDLCLIETGSMAGLLENRCAGVGIGLCQLALAGGTETLPEALRLGPNHEVLHAMLGGALLRAGESPADPARRGDGGDPVAELRAHLAARLPNYMQPQHLAVIESLPLTPQGKVDRNAVEHLVATDRKPVDTSPPADDLEARIAAVFQQVLSIDVIGVDAGFFDLGADSTAIVRAYRLLRAELDRPFPLTDMFRHASVRGLARALSGQDTAERDELLSSARRRAGRGRMARRRHRRPTPELSPSREGPAS